MGAASSVSANAIFDDLAQELRLDSNQRQKYKTLYLELCSQSGMNDTKIRDDLIAAYKCDQGGQLSDEQIKVTQSLSSKYNDMSDNDIKVSKSTSALPTLITTNFPHVSASMLSPSMSGRSSLSDQAPATAPKGNSTTSSTPSYMKITSSAVTKATLPMVKSTSLQTKNRKSIVNKTPLHITSIVEEEKSTKNEEPDDSGTYCDICLMHFKTTAKYETHVQFSDYHATLAKERDAAQKFNDRARKIALLIHEGISKVTKILRERNTSIERHNNKAKERWLWAYEKVKINIAAAKTEELLKNHYRHFLPRIKLNQVKLLYDGSKLFWRTQESIELHMYLHDDFDVIESTLDKSPILEVVGFDVKTQVEYPRLYINYNIIFNYLLEKIKTKIMKKRSDEFQNRLDFDQMNNVFDLKTLSSSEQKYLTTIICEYIADKISLQGITRRMLAFGQYTDDFVSNAQSRISSNAAKLPELPNAIMENGHYISKDKNTLSQDIKELLSMTGNVPDNAITDETIVLNIIKPVEIIRRRRTTEIERNAAMENLSNTARELSSLTNKASTFGEKTKAVVRNRLGIKTESEDLDDIVSKYMTLMKEGEKVVPEPSTVKVRPMSASQLPSASRRPSRDLNSADRFMRPTVASEVYAATK